MTLQDDDSKADQIIEKLKYTRRELDEQELSKFVLEELAAIERERQQEIASEIQERRRQDY